MEQSNELKDDEIQRMAEELKATALAADREDHK